jgi:hypothetical protein
LGRELVLLPAFDPFEREGDAPGCPDVAAGAKDTIPEGEACIAEVSVHLGPAAGGVAVAERQGVLVAAAGDVVDLEDLDLVVAAAGADGATVGIEAEELEISVDLATLVNAGLAVAIAWSGRRVFPATPASTFLDPLILKALHRFAKPLAAGHTTCDPGNWRDFMAVGT